MKRKHIVLIVINGVSLLFFAIMTLLAAGVKKSLPDQHVIERWTDGSERYSQVSVFIEPISAMDINSVFMLRSDVEKKLVEYSLVSENKNARMWADAFSFKMKKATVSSDYGNAETDMIVTGGDFFLFHPLELISGYYYSDDDLMFDRVVIDDVTAWKLYGSSDIAGKHVIIGGKYFFIAGVYSRDGIPEAEKLLGERSVMFMPYQGSELLGNDNYFTCYEACLPDPVTGLGEKIITDAINVKEDQRRGVENSTRYSLKKRFGIVSEFGMRSVRDDGVVYPHWENAARISEDKSALLLVMQAAGLVVPSATAAVYIVIGYRKRKVFFSRFVNAVKRIFNKLVIKIKSIERKGDK